jgi:hypothetical protein
MKVHFIFDRRRASSANYLEFPETIDCFKFWENNTTDSVGGIVCEYLEKNPVVLGFPRACHAQTDQNNEAYESGVPSVVDSFLIAQ